MSLVLWSGGCDSTLILDGLLVNSSEYYPVRALTIIHDQVHPKKQPAKARERAKDYWKKKGYHLDHTEVKITRKGDIQATNYGQPIFWLSFAIPHLRDKEDLFLGYIREDCVWHRKENLYNVFDEWMKMSRRTGKLRTPFEWAHKSTIVNALKKSGLLKKTWWCEKNSESKKPCGSCFPCQSYLTAEWRIEQGWEKDELLPGVFY